MISSSGTISASVNKIFKKSKAGWIFTAVGWDDWEAELAVPIPSTSKSKTTPTLSKGKSPGAGPSKGQSPLTVSRPPLTVKKPSRFGQAAKEGKKLAKEVLKLKRQPGWSEWGEKVQRKLHGKDY